MHMQDRLRRWLPEADVLLAADGCSGPEFAPLGHCLQGPAPWRSSRRWRVAALLISGGLLAGLLASATLGARGLAGRPGAAAASPPLQLYENGELDYEVQYEGYVEVYQSKSKDAPVLGTKFKCTIMLGKREGDWVRLMSEPGYIPVSKDNTTALKSIPVYAKIARGHCADIGMFPVRDAHTCELAAAAMQLPDTELQEIVLVPLPEGCHMFNGTRSMGLYLATNPINRGNGATRFHEPICSSYEEPPEKCRLPTTTVTTTTTSTTWGWPSIFCVIVAARDQTDVLRLQLEQRAGGFACDEIMVFAEGEAMLLGEWAAEDFYTRPLPGGAGVQMTNDSFLPLWRTVEEDGRYRKHDWTVSASPETVFFPERLRLHLRAHTPVGGERLFFEKCDRFNPTRHYGGFEVRSRAALDDFASGEETCKAALPWWNFTEEEFLQTCLERLKVGSIFDADVLQDSACGSVNCWDKSKVAFHAMHDADSYLECWRHASQ
uniref:Uncharacterized protein n=1 Tax=Alexandrium catenella TaxID=2925 RepID=A0A7S1RHE7_ALECA|mmetsp:Transcript_58642/g.157005  ORF Transcript_58642/g.157005 Transcript_58642/m.157005 type:complete len:491 (+) Transcript_58642:85-1557(+)